MYSPEKSPLMAGATSALSTQVEDQLNGLGSLSDDLEKMVVTLRARLASVTRQKDEKEPGPGTPREMLVPLAEKMRNIGDSFNSSINALRELNAAIELPEN